MNNGKYIAFKGNFTVTENNLPVGKTGMFFRDISGLMNPVIAIADTSTMIPGQAATDASSLISRVRSAHSRDQPHCNMGDDRSVPPGMRQG